MRVPKEKKDVVAIIAGNFIEPTEIWISRHVNGLLHHGPIVISKRKTKHLTGRTPKVFALKSFSFFTQPLNLVGRALLGKRFLGNKLIMKFIMRVCKVRIVHIHFLWNGIWFFDYLAKPNIPVFITAHGSDVNKAVSDPIYRKKVQNVFNRADKIICVSRFIKERLILLGCAEQKLIVNYIGTPIKNIVRPKFKEREKITLLCVAALREEKGHEYLLKAMAQVIREAEDIQLLLVGDGELRERVINFIDILKLKKHVQLLGWKGEEEIFELLSGADIYVQHSVKCIVEDKILKEEGLPISLVEAAGMGLPIVATDVGGIREICIHKHNGLLCEEKNFLDMANQILTLIQNPEMRLSLGRAGRDLVLKTFDESKMLKNLEAFYQEN
ncbi:glycosyltransferase family 4 protein [Acidobacteriota bacterium]